MSRVPNKIKVGSEVFWSATTSGGSATIIISGIVDSIGYSQRIQQYARVSRAKIYAVDAPNGIDASALRAALDSGYKVPMRILKNMEDIKWQTK